MRGMCGQGKTYRRVGKGIHNICANTRRSGPFILKPDT
jgi:hypothetical protein